MSTDSFDFFNDLFRHFFSHLSKVYWPRCFHFPYPFSLNSTQSKMLLPVVPLESLIWREKIRLTLLILVKVKSRVLLPFMRSRLIPRRFRLFLIILFWWYLPCEGLSFRSGFKSRLWSCLWLWLLGQLDDDGERLDHTLFLKCHSVRVDNTCRQKLQKKV